MRIWVLAEPLALPALLYYGGRELPLKILKFVGIIIIIIFFNFDLLLIFLFKIKVSESEM